MKTTESGYTVRIDLFFHCHPEDIDSMRAADHAIGMLPKALDGVSNVATVLIGKRKWIAARRKSPAPALKSNSIEVAAQGQPAAGSTEVHSGTRIGIPPDSGTRPADGAAPEEKPASSGAAADDYVTPPPKWHGTLEEAVKRATDAAGGSRNPEDAIFSDRRVPR